MTRISSILITGASSGLGAGLAKSYAAPGVHLVLTARDAARLEATAAACRAKGATVATGLFDVREAEPLGAWLLEQDDATPLDLIIAAAGVSAGTGANDMPEGLELAAMQVRANLLGTIHTVEPLLPRMIARGAGASLDGARLAGRVALGAGSVLEDAATLEDVVALAGTRVGAECLLRRVLLAPHTAIPDGTELTDAAAGPAEDGSLWVRSLA